MEDAQFRATRKLWKRPKGKSYKDWPFGRSVMIGFQKTQIYQRFAGSRQEVFILNISVQNCYLGNNVTQAIFPHKIVQNIIGCITNFLLLSICKCDAVLISVKTNAILQSFPEKDRFSAANNAFFEIGYGFEEILFSRIKRIFHNSTSKSLKLWCSIGIFIAPVIRMWLLKIRDAFSGKLPIDFMVVWVRMKFGVGGCSMVPFRNSSTITSNFRLNF